MRATGLSIQIWPNGDRTRWDWEVWQGGVKVESGFQSSKVLAVEASGAARQRAADGESRVHPAAEEES